MTMYLLFSLSLCFFFIMPMMLHPLSLGVSILFCSLVTCLLIGVMSYSWFGFILFLIFVGGLLIMFAYVSALTPNVYFSGTKLIFWFLGLWMMTSIFFYQFFFSDFIFVNNMMETSFSISKMSMGEKLMSPSHIFILVGLGLILLLNLLAVVKICYYQQGPLRQHFT